MVHISRPTAGMPVNILTSVSSVRSRFLDYDVSLVDPADIKNPPSSRWILRLIRFYFELETRLDKRPMEIAHILALPAPQLKITQGVCEYQKFNGRKQNWFITHYLGSRAS